MCGVVGIVSQSPVFHQIYDALLALQHRGQDSAGMVTWDAEAEGRLRLRKGNGLVREIFEERHMQRLRGNMGVGHVRYPTAGSSSAAEAQPMYVNAPYGISLAHNGNLTNARQLEDDVFKSDLRHVNTDSDSEILLNVFAHELYEVGALKPDAEDVFKALRGVYERCRGAYAAVAMINGHGIVAFRRRPRHPAAGLRRAHHRRRRAGGHGGLREQRRGHPRVRLRARHRPWRGHIHRRKRAVRDAPMCAEGPAHAVHLRARLPGP